MRIAIADDASLARPETLVQIAARFLGPKRGAVLDLPPRSADRARPPPDFAGPEFDR